MTISHISYPFHLSLPRFHLPMSHPVISVSGDTGKSTLSNRISEDVDLMPSLPMAVVYTRENWLRDLSTIFEWIEQDNAFTDEFRWQHYHEVLLWFLLQAQSIDGFSFTMASQFSWDREFVDPDKPVPFGTPIDSKTCTFLEPPTSKSNLTLE